MPHGEERECLRDSPAKEDGRNHTTMKAWMTEGVLYVENEGSTDANPVESLRDWLRKTIEQIDRITASDDETRS